MGGGHSRMQVPRKIGTERGHSQQREVSRENSDEAGTTLSNSLQNRKNLTGCVVLALFRACRINR